VEVAAFRTAVEAVNNVVRHADAHRCTIELRVEQGCLVLEISDDGESRTDWTAGVGVLAMRERASELGGTLSAGATAQGGMVRATFPLSPPLMTGSAP